MTTGIYKIENLINGHVYIGQAVDITRRWTTEKRDAFCETSPSYEYPISRAFRKYGLDNFSFEILEECLIADLNNRERYWIKYYNSFFDGYNQTLGGDAGHSEIKDKKHIIGIIQDLMTTNLYHREIAEKWNVSIEMVQGINTGRYWRQDDVQYPLQTQHKKHSNHYTAENKLNAKEENKVCIDCGAQISYKAIRCKKCADIAAHKVKHPSAEALYQQLINNNGNFCKTAQYYGVSDNALRKWCKNYGLPSKSTEFKTIIRQSNNK